MIIFLVSLFEGLLGTETRDYQTLTSLFIFKGYSFIAPSVLFSKNAIADELLSEECTATNRPGEVTLIYASLFEVSEIYERLACFGPLFFTSDLILL